MSPWLQVGRLDDAEHVGARVLPALDTAPGRAAVDQVWLLLSTPNPAAEPASAEARDVLRFFLESLVKRCRLTASEPVLKALALAALETRT